jgi:hypothetical protein
MGSFRRWKEGDTENLGIQLKGEGKSVDRGVKLDEGKMKGVDESSVKELS